MSFAPTYNDLTVLHTAYLKNRWLMYQTKRNMLKKTCEMLYKGVTEHTPAAPTEFFFAGLTRRNFATWNVCVRKAEPLKGIEPPRDIDPESGLEIMNSCDFSGKNHAKLIDRDFKSDEFYKAYGSFTTKVTPWNGKAPEFISNVNLRYENIKQYFYSYDKPILMRKSDVIIDEIGTIAVSHDEYIRHFKNIRT